MHFIYTRHTRIRMGQRRLSARQIEETVARPDQTKPGYGGKHLAQKSFRGKILEVVYRESGGRIVLITAYWLEET